MVGVGKGSRSEGATQAKPLPVEYREEEGLNVIWRIFRYSAVVERSTTYTQFAAPLPQSRLARLLNRMSLPVKGPSYSPPQVSTTHTYYPSNTPAIRHYFEHSRAQDFPWER